jgi:hypothetical protein
MITEIQTPLFMRPYIVASLTGMREEWEETAEGKSLVDMKGSVGLLLFDFISAIGLTQEERDQVLGASLLGDVQSKLSISGMG